MTRKMATVQEIVEVIAIPDADKICQYRVLGWKVVDQVGKYNVGDLVVYCEVDSFIPTAIAPFLTKPEHYPKVYDGVSGERLKTIRLRKALSQGLLLPMSCLTNYGADLEVGTDVAATLGIQKWEPEMSPQMAGMAKGMFPSFIPKTDQERIQNLGEELEFWKTKNLTWSVSEKCEGSSFTAYFNRGEFGVCSRNLELKEVEGNTLWDTAKQYDLKTKLEVLGKNVAIQAEILGPGIQGNMYKLTKFMLAVFDVYDIDKQEYYPPVAKKQLIEELGLTSVPILQSAFSLKDMTIDSLLEMADGKSVMGVIGCLREGLVFNCNEYGSSFKAVSNQYLLKAG